MSDQQQKSKTTWIAVDCGMSDVRVWAMGEDNRLLAQRTSHQALGDLQADQFEAVLLGIIDEFLTPDAITPVICCGVMGDAQGARFVATPCVAPSGDQLVRVATHDTRIAVSIVPGVKQENPADVMQGEETQVAGFIAQNPDFDGVLCVLGTHSKWVHISAAEIVSFQTFMTGELYALLSRKSVLRTSIAVKGWDDAAFETALGEAISRPESVAAKLFGLRAQFLVGAGSPQAARARLSGLLIGLELAATRPYWLGQNLAIVGETDVAGMYQTALALQGLSATVHDAQSVTRDGLIAARDGQV